ncbi:MAG: hypothetical protein AAF488_00285 [Planctomycetota bacterium]
MEELPVYEQQWIIVNARYRALRDLGFTLSTTVWGIVLWVWITLDFAYPSHFGSALLLLLFFASLFVRAARRYFFEQELKEKLDHLQRSVVWVEGDAEPDR